MFQLWMGGGRWNHSYRKSIVHPNVPTDQADGPPWKKSCHIKFFKKPVTVLVCLFFFFWIDFEL